MPVSSTLYLFGSEALLASLKQGYIPFGSDVSFLEPFINFAQFHQEHKQPVTSSEFLTQLKVEYDKLPDNIRCFLSFDDFQNRSDSLAESINNKVLSGRKPKAHGYDVSRLEKAAFLRLFESPVSNYGWTELARNYKGMCIGLKTQSSLFESCESRVNLLAPVQYGAEHETQVSVKNPFPGFFMDDLEFQNRREWRSIYVKSQLAEDGLKLPKGALVQAYISISADVDFKADVLRFFSQDMRFRSASLFEVVPDIKRWGLTAHRMIKE